MGAEHIQRLLIMVNGEVQVRQTVLLVQVAHRAGHSEHEAEG